MAPQPQAGLVRCEVCDMYLDKDKFTNHLKSKNHKQNERLAKLKKLKSKENN